MELESHAIQGLVRYGYRELCSARFLLLSLPARAAARDWLAAVVPHVQTAAAPPTETAVNVAFTATGLARLGLDATALSTFACEFLEGMGSIPYRNEQLGDVDGSAPEHWQWGGPTGAIDAVLLLYGRTDAVLARLATRQQALRELFGVQLLRELETQTLPPSDTPVLREHFGFLDGLAQPAVRGWDTHGGASNTVRPGEFVLGYENEYGQLPDSPQIGTPHAGLGGRDLGRNGTYLVLRQLEQDVHGFWRSLRDGAGGDPQGAIALAARMVGRWPNGAPVVLADSDVADWHEQPFGYAAADPQGLRCPLGSHIRRTNPRDGLPGASPADSAAIVNRHRILRRGRPYGQVAPAEPKVLLEQLDGTVDADGERGLYFIGINANIARQFEFIQQDWMNSPGFVRGEQDPLCGDRMCGAPTGRFTVQEVPLRRRVSGLARFIHVRGGVYAFLPSIPALHYLTTP